MDVILHSKARLSYITSVSFSLSFCSFVTILRGISGNKSEGMPLAEFSSIYRSELNKMHRISQPISLSNIPKRK